MQVTKAIRSTHAHPIAHARLRRRKRPANSGQGKMHFASYSIPPPLSCTNEAVLSVIQERKVIYTQCMSFETTPLLHDPHHHDQLSDDLTTTPETIFNMPLFKIGAGFIASGMTAGAFGAHALKGALHGEKTATWQTASNYLIFNGGAFSSLSVLQFGDGVQYGSTADSPVLRMVSRPPCTFSEPVCSPQGALVHRYGCRALLGIHICPPHHQVSTISPRVSVSEWC